MGRSCSGTFRIKRRAMRRSDTDMSLLPSDLGGTSRRGNQEGKSQFAEWGEEGQPHFSSERRTCGWSLPFRNFEI